MYQLLLGIILMVVVEFQYPAVIAYGILIAGRTLAYKPCICKGLDIIAVKCNLCSQRHGQALRQPALFLDVLQEGRHISRLPLGGGI